MRRLSALALARNTRLLALPTVVGFVLVAAGSGAAAPPSPRLTAIAPTAPLAGETISFQLRAAAEVGRPVSLEKRVGNIWKVVTRGRIRKATILLSVRVATPGLFQFRAATPLLSNVVSVRVRGNGLRRVLRADVVSIPPADAKSVVTTRGRSIVSLDRGAAAPSVGRLLVIPASRRLAGVLGRVVRVNASANGTTIVDTAPVSLDEAYSTLSVAVSGTLGELSRSGAVRVTQGAHPARSDSFPLTCKTSGGTAVNPTVDLSKLHLDFDLTTYPPSIHFLLYGTPVLGLQVKTTGALNCSLNDPVPIAFFIPGTPILVQIAPRFDIDAAGTTTISLSWSPRIAIGFDRAPGIDSDFHVIGGSATTVNASLSGQASAWMAGTLDVSVAGRLGVTGAFGPLGTATASAPPPCVTLDGALKATLDSYANVFFKNYTFSLASGTYDNFQLYHECQPSPPPPPAGPQVVSINLTNDVMSLGGIPVTPAATSTEFDNASFQLGGDLRSAFGGWNLCQADPNGSSTAFWYGVSLLVNFPGTGTCGGAVQIHQFQISRIGWTVKTNLGDFSTGEQWTATPSALRAAASVYHSPSSDYTEYFLGECPGQLDPAAALFLVETDSTGAINLAQSEASRVGGKC